MFTRRQAILGLLTSPMLLRVPPALAQVEPRLSAYINQLAYPPFDALDRPVPGSKPSYEEMKARAAEMIRTTPKGPRPIDVAQSFFDRFVRDGDPESVSQWPQPAPWNPLIAAFFSATSVKANNDIIPWCGAFVNWCIQRAGKSGTGNAGSQSFLSNPKFKNIDDPSVGDLVVFTCYDKKSGESLGLGHVAFVKQKPLGGQIMMVGAHETADVHSSIISEIYYPVGEREVKRLVDGQQVICLMRVNTYVTMV